MSDWSEEMAARIREKSNSQRACNETADEDERLKKEFGPKMWAAIMSDVRAESQALNAELERELVVIESSSDTELVVRTQREDGRQGPRVRVQFDPELGRVAWSSKSFEIAWERGSKPMFRSDDGLRIGTGSIARQILESIIDA